MPSAAAIPRAGEVDRKFDHVRMGSTKLPNSCIGQKINELIEKPKLFAERPTIKPSQSNWRVMYSKLIDRGVVNGAMVSCSVCAIPNPQSTIKTK